MSKRKFIIYLLILLIGFNFRYALSFRHNEIEGDEWQFQVLVSDILSGKLAVTCCTKNAGYALILAPIEFLFGQENLFAVRIVQIFIDLSTAILLFLTARKLFPDRVAFLIFSLYIFNPLTSSFAGLLLTEIVTFFIIALIAYLLANPSFKTRRILWIVNGFLFGVLVFIRLQFIYFGLFYILVLGIFQIKKHLKLLFILLNLTGFLIASSYSLISYYTNYQVISFVPPFTAKWAQLYSNFYDIYRWPELNGQPKPNQLDLNISKISDEYAAVTYREYASIEKIYRIRFYRKIRTDWPVFLKNTGRNLIWLWDKYHISEFYDPFYPGDIIPVRIYNIILFILGILGIAVYWIKKGMNALSCPVLGLTVCLFVYMTFTFPLVDNESRHTLPFYPLLLIWAGYGINIILKKISKLHLL
jgi:4-amino-4-deoxy-L-arabinose transferase-like glycosyltransferase